MKAGLLVAPLDKDSTHMKQHIAGEDDNLDGSVHSNDDVST